MKLIVGLGNNFLKYKFTYHNIGFLAVDYICKKLNANFSKNKSLNSLIAEKEEFILCKPLGFINTCGGIIKKVVSFYNINISEEFMVIMDDLNLDFGMLKLKPQGSSGGHKGLFSIIENLNTQRFPRLRIGVGRPAESSEFKDYVLRKMPISNLKFLRKKVFPYVWEAVNIWSKENLQKAMQFINSLN